MTLNRDTILAAKDIHIELLHVPEWSGDVYIKTLSGAERDKLESEIIEFGANGQPKKMRMDKIRSLICALAICDENGERLFGDKDIDALAEKSAAALDRVSAKATNMAGMSQGDIDTLVDGLKNEQAAALPSD